MLTRIRPIRSILALATVVVLATVASPHAQINQNAAPVTITVQYALVPIASTAAVATQTTLTIPAPPPTFSNYICSLHYNASQNGTSTANTNLVTTSTNFNSYAIKYSLAATANTNYDWVEGWGIANTGCAKSTSPGTATTFVSPSAQTNTAFTWTATYYQAP